MYKIVGLLPVWLFCAPLAQAQEKKPLDHSVYDQWQSLGERTLSPDGRWAIYTIAVQEGDATTYVQRTDGKGKYAVPRGYQAQMSADGRYAALKIKPRFQDTRQARIAKKKPDDMPKDSLLVLELGQDTVREIRRYAAVKAFGFSEQTHRDYQPWLAIHLEKAEPPKREMPKPDSNTRIARMQRQADSLVQVADSLRRQLAEIKAKGFQAINALTGKPAANTARPASTDDEEGTELLLFHPGNYTTLSYPRVREFVVSKQGQMMAIETSRNRSDTSSKAAIVKLRLGEKPMADTIMYGLNDAKNLSLSENGNLLAFVAERDSSKKESKKFWTLYAHRNGEDSASALVGKSHKAMRRGFVVSENARIRIGADEQRLLFGLAVDLPDKDTSLPEFERVSVDVWNYKDDYLQTTQLYNLNRELRRSYTALITMSRPEQFELLSDSAANFADRYTKSMDGRYFYLLSDTGRRIAQQWQGFARQDVYVLNADGNRKLVMKNLKGSISPSPNGAHCLIYNDETRGYTLYTAATGSLKPMAKDIAYPLYDEENDVPDDPNPYSQPIWNSNENSVMIRDKYDVYELFTDGKPSRKITQLRSQKIMVAPLNLDREKETISYGDTVFLRGMEEKTKNQLLYTFVYTAQDEPVLTLIQKGNMNYTGIVKAKNAPQLLFGEENFMLPPQMVAFNYGSTATELPRMSRMVLATTNAQQENYRWGKAELFTWKAYTGKITEGIVYKPDDMIAGKKYPMIVYFYERNNETLHNYQAPAPTPSRLNIPFFVSRGYIVFVPDIWYTTGKPGQSAYDYIVSGTRALVKQGFVDSTRIGIQGQSWGGYQVAHLITRTNLYKAAWAGAPVANMTSAYGGIRWESGLNRQFQYEKQQSRIGATLWDKPQLYIENSPLFHLPKVKTPLVIMHNDADGAVPWYQGIELFTGLRRLGKPVWMLNYNGEAHNLIERKNRKDIQVREQQFFDWLLQDAAPPAWIEKGVPAVLKGRVTR